MQPPNDVELTGFEELQGADLLQKVPLFAQLNFEETRRIAAILRPVTLEAGDIVIEQDALGDALFLIETGEVVVTRDANRDGFHADNEVLGRLGPGSVVGEMSLVDDLLTSARVTTDSRCTLLRMDRRDFEALIAQDERLAFKIYRSFCRALSERLRTANLQLLGEV